MKDLTILHLNKKILDPKDEIDQNTWLEFVSITQDFFQKATLELGMGLLSEFLDHKKNYFPEINDYVQISGKDLFGIYCGAYKGKARIFLDEPIIKKGRSKYIYLTNYKNIRSANKYEN